MKMNNEMEYKMKSEHNKLMLTTFFFILCPEKYARCIKKLNRPKIR